MKAEVRTIGFDDSPHTRADGRVPIVGVHMRGAMRVEGLVATDVERDGGDATNRVARCVSDSGLRGLKAILLDGASFGGFNVVDLDSLHQETGIASISFTKGVPDMDAMRAALRNVPQPEAKWALLSARKLVRIPTESTPLTISFAGIDERGAIEVLAATTARGHTPEPLRLAHMIAALMR